jgi:hypothetical protein
MTSPLETLAWDEIVVRHAFFVDWFTGTGPETAMDETARCFAPDFHMIAPDGSQLDREAVLSMLQNARGSRTSGHFAIEVEMRRTVRPGPDLALVVYDELQRTDEGQTKRRSTALFSSDPQAPGGVVWRHLHETWITTEQNE